MLGILIWCGTLSVAAFFATALDKYRAVNGRWRVSEARLLTLGFLGGWPGLIVGMLLFRHKTSKTSFRLAASAIVVVHGVIAGWWLTR